MEQINPWYYLGWLLLFIAVAWVLAFLYEITQDVRLWWRERNRERREPSSEWET